MPKRSTVAVVICVSVCAATVAVHAWLIARGKPHATEGVSPPPPPTLADTTTATNPSPAPPKPFLTIRQTYSPTPAILRPDPALPEKRLPVGESAWEYEARGVVQFRLLYGYTAEGKKTETHVLAEFPRVGPDREAAWRERRLPPTLDHMSGRVVLRYPAPLMAGQFTVSQAYSGGGVPAGILYTDEEVFRFPNEPRVLDGWEKWARWDGWPKTSSMWFDATHTSSGEFLGKGPRTVAEGGESVLHEWAEGSAVVDGLKPGAFVQLVVRRVPPDRVKALTTEPK